VFPERSASEEDEKEVCFRLEQFWKVKIGEEGSGRKGFKLDWELLEEGFNY
jgi:hypothetical protein